MLTEHTSPRAVVVQLLEGRMSFTVGDDEVTLAPADVVYLAPKMIGQGQGMANFGPLETLAQALPLAFKSTDMLGPDLRLVAEVCGRSQF